MWKETIAGLLFLHIYAYAFQQMSHRTNFCPLAHDVLHGNIALSHGLEGMTVTIGIPSYPIDPFYFNFTSNGTIIIPNGGFMFDLHNKIADQGSFKFQYVALPPIGQLTYSQYILNSAQVVDVLGDNWYSDTGPRRLAGITFTPTVVDASLLLVTTYEFKNTAFSYFSFGKAFPSLIWGLIIVSVIANTLVRLLIDHHVHAKEADEECRVKLQDNSVLWYIINFAKNLYLSIGSFTQSHYVYAETPAAAILNAIYSFLMATVFAEYTVGLVTASIISPIFYFPVQSIEDANNRGLSICVESGSVAEGMVKSKYPNINIVPISPSGGQSIATEIARAMTIGLKCKAVVLSTNSWDQVQFDVNANPNCNLKALGKFRSISGAWPSQVDFSTYCTSMANTVLSWIITNMTSSGELTALWDSDVSDTATIRCPANGAPLTGVNLQAAATQSFYGIFMVFFSFAMIVLLFVYMTPRSNLARPSNHPLSEFMRSLLEPWHLVNARHGAELSEKGGFVRTRSRSDSDDAMHGMDPDIDSNNPEE